VWVEAAPLGDGRAAALAVRGEERWLLAEDCELVVGQLRHHGPWRTLLFLRGRPGPAWDGLVGAVSLAPCAEPPPSEQPLPQGRWSVSPGPPARCGWPLDTGAWGRNLGELTSTPGPGASLLAEEGQAGWLRWAGVEGEALIGPVPAGSAPLGAWLGHDWWALPAEAGAPARVLGLARRRGGEPRWAFQVWGLAVPAVGADRQGLSLADGQRLLWPEVRS
jgi:hypothetical protein